MLESASRQVEITFRAARENRKRAEGSTPRITVYGSKETRKVGPYARETHPGDACVGERERCPVGEPAFPAHDVESLPAGDAAWRSAAAFDGTATGNDDRFADRIFYSR